MGNLKVIIVGASPFSSLMRIHLENTSSYEVRAYAVNKQYIQEEEYDSLPLLALEDIATQMPAETVFLNTVGYKDMCEGRKKTHIWLKEYGFELLTYVHPHAAVNSPVGEGSIVLENSYIGYCNTIGEGSIIWNAVSIGHRCNIGDFTYWGPGAVSCGNVTVGNNCFIGANATLRNRITVANRTLVGAGVYMNRSVAEENLIFKAPYPIEVRR